MAEPMKFASFIKACQAFFQPKVSIPEFKALTTQDKYELSDMLNEAGYTHPRYAPVETS